MKLWGKLVKFFGYVGIYLVTLLQCYGMSLIVSGSIMSIVCAIMSIFIVLPRLIIEKFWLVLLLGSIPIAILFFIIVVTGVLVKNERLKK